MNYDNKWVDYTTALGLLEPIKPSLAEKTKVRRTNLGIQFDNVDEANEFMMETYDIKKPRPAFKPEMSFINPRDPEELPTDYSRDYCTLM